MASTIELLLLAQSVNPVPWNYVGAAGQPAFAADWANYGHGANNLAFRSILDVVEIIGEVTPSSGAADLLFTLPAAYRPVSTQFIWGFDTVGSAGYWSVISAGAVSLGGTGLTDGHEYLINGQFSMTV